MPVKIHTLPSQARLLELFSYDPATGVLRWKVWCGGKATAGSIVGYKTTKAMRVRIDYVSYAVHRVIWKMVTGHDPVAQIDHRNGLIDDNRWTNLREATQSQNQGNARMRMPNETGLKGVRLLKDRFQARIQINKRTVYLGCYGTAKEAHDAYIAAAKQYFGPFYNPG
jgi:hypothetical protein